MAPTGISESLADSGIVKERMGAPFAGASIAPCQQAPSRLGSEESRTFASTMQTEPLEALERRWAASAQMRPLSALPSMAANVTARGASSARIRKILCTSSSSSGLTDSSLSRNSETALAAEALALIRSGFSARTSLSLDRKYATFVLITLHSPKLNSQERYETTRLSSPGRATSHP